MKSRIGFYMRTICLKCEYEGPLDTFVKRRHVYIPYACSECGSLNVEENMKYFDKLNKKLRKSRRPKNARLEAWSRHGKII